MFSPSDRERIRQAILEHARTDERITGGAMTGSASVGKEDEWSDIDLAFGVKEGVDLKSVIQTHTDFMYTKHGALHHLDVYFNAWIYRVFFLSNTLQVDLAFVADRHFGATGASFKLVFGDSREALLVGYPDAEMLIGYAWLYAIHVRSCIQRGKFWQAEHMLSGMRDRVLTLACIRYDLPAAEGRGFDQLPVEVLKSFAHSHVGALDGASLRRAFRCITEALIKEARLFDAALAERLTPVLNALLGGAIEQGSFDAFDALVAAPLHHRLLLENDAVRVLDTKVGSGEIVPMHTHSSPAAHYVISWSDFVRRGEDGKVQLDTRAASDTFQPHTAIWSGPLERHTLENVGEADLHIVSIEVKPSTH